MILTMSEPLEQLAAAVVEAQRADYLDPILLRSLIDRLEGLFCRVVRQGTAHGDHMVTGHCSAVAWLVDTCHLSQPAASDRLCVGKQLESMPVVAEALSSGQIGYQSASVICHLHEKLEEKGEQLDQEMWVGYAREFSVKGLKSLSDHARYVIDPDGFERDTEENYEERFLHISEMNGMYHLSGVMDPRRRGRAQDRDRLVVQEAWDRGRPQ